MAKNITIILTNIEITIIYLDNLLQLLLIIETPFIE